MKESSIALVGDLHYGSRYTCYDKIKEFYKECKKQKVTKCYQVGDLLEGDYRHHRPKDLIAHGFDEQVALLNREHPKEIPEVFIEGNHDQTFDKQGLDVGKAIEKYTGLKCVGERQAVVNDRGLRICLFHPGFGGSKSNYLGVSPTRLAPTSALEKFLVGIKHRKNPHIVAVGHWHQSSYFQYQGMHVFLCGTFQGPGGAFSNSLDTVPAVGSWILHVEGKKIKPEWIGF